MDWGAAQETLGRRIQKEYRETPALRLTLWQAGKLWNVPNDVCEATMTSLVRSGFLYQEKDGQFRRA